MKQKYVVGNWKMNGTRAEVRSLVTNLSTQTAYNALVVLCPPFCYLPLVGNLIHHTTDFVLGAQNCHSQPKGAFTGEISPGMLVDLGVSYVILGHSERRQHAGETNGQVGEKAQMAQEAKLIPIICVGETQMDKELGHTKTIITQQLTESLPADFQGLIAYEPIWAIGTGHVPDLQDIQDTHRLIQELTNRPVLYGGSVNAANARDILHLPEVAGVLVGGASLDAYAFSAIIDAAP